jgi:intein-encoded DNA endonuclease-like protein
LNILPTLERQKIYDEVRRLKQADAGIDLRTVRRELAGRFPVLPSRMTLQRWLNGESSPTTSMNKFDSVPSDALSFFLGAWTGDGWADENDGGKRLLLKVRSRECAEEFARAATEILQKVKPYKVRVVDDSNGRWYLVKVTSLLLYSFATQPFSGLMPFAVARPTAFLRGFFTAEGNPSVSISRRDHKLELTLCASNTEIEYLQFCGSLLTSLDYHPTRIAVGDRPGLNRIIRNRHFVTTKIEWQIRIARLHEIERYLSEIGFADSAKQEKASTAWECIRTYGSMEAANVWTRHYTKIRGRWTQRDPNGGDSAFHG